MGMEYGGWGGGMELGGGVGVWAGGGEKGMGVWVGGAGWWGIVERGCGGWAGGKGGGSEDCRGIKLKHTSDYKNLPPLSLLLCERPRLPSICLVISNQSHNTNFSKASLQGLRRRGAPSWQSSRCCRIAQTLFSIQTASGLNESAFSIKKDVCVILPAPIL